jgi:hypothetical protein
MVSTSFKKEAALLTLASETHVRVLNYRATGSKYILLYATVFVVI